MTDKRTYYGLWAAIALLLLLNLGTIGWIVLRTRQFRSNWQSPHGFIAKRLDFTAQQQAAYKDIREKFLINIRPHEDSLRLLRNDLYGRLDQSTASDDRIDELIDQMNRQNGQIARLRFRHWQQVRQLCTPAQQTRFDRLMVRVTQGLNRPAKTGFRERWRNKLNK